MSLESLSTSTSLLGRLRAADPQAWRDLCRLYGPLVYRWAREAGVKDADAADVGQEVFHTVAVRLGEFRRESPKDSFRGWLWTITYHKLGDHFRRRQTDPQGFGGNDANQKLAHLEAPTSSATESAINPDARLLILRRAMDMIQVEFEPATWQAFWQIVVEGKAAVDVAAELGTTPQAVRQNKYRVLRRLRALVDEP